MEKHSTKHKTPRDIPLLKLSEVTTVPTEGGESTPHSDTRTSHTPRSGRSGNHTPRQGIRNTLRQSDQHSSHPSPHSLNINETNSLTRMLEIWDIIEEDTEIKNTEVQISISKEAALTLLRVYSENPETLPSKSIPWSEMIRQVANLGVSPSENRNNGGILGENRNIKIPKILDSSRRAKIVEEILNTEKTYVQSLSQVVQIYINPLKINGILSDTQREVCFSDVEIISELNTIFLERLEKATVDQVGEIFQSNAPLFKLYYRYIRNFTFTQKHLEDCIHDISKFAQFCEECKIMTKGQSLQSFLIMPVQRLPRYEILLQALLKETSSDHPDLHNLTKALQYIREVNLYINERKRDEETKDEIMELLKTKVSKTLKKTEDIRGYLSIDVIAGKNLPILDKNGFSDPYLIISFGTQRWKTKILRKTLNPHWNERFIFHPSIVLQVHSIE